MLRRVLPLLVVAAVLVGCAPVQPVSEATTDPVSEETPRAAVLTPGESLVARAGSELGGEVLPAGYSFEDAVDVDGSGLVSHIYGGPEGPAGPVLYIHTGGSTAALTGRYAAAVQERLPGVSDNFLVTIARDRDKVRRTNITIVTIDASPAGVVRLIGELPEADVVLTARRLVDGPS